MSRERIYAGIFVYETDGTIFLEKISSLITQVRIGGTDNGVSPCPESKPDQTVVGVRIPLPPQT